MTRIASIALYFTEALVYVLSGVYGAIQSIGAGNGILIVMQLLTVGIILVLLEDAHQKGYGITSSFVSLAMVLNTCSEVIWQVNYYYYAPR